MKTIILNNRDMVITIPKEEKDLQLHHLNSLEPKDKLQFDELTELFAIVNNKPNLKLIIGGKNG